MQKPSSSSNSSRKRQAAAAGGALGGCSGSAAVAGRRSGTSGGQARCPYLGAGSSAAATVHDVILAQPMDIEELGKLGEWERKHPDFLAANLTTACPSDGCARLPLSPAQCSSPSPARQLISGQCK